MMQAGLFNWQTRFEQLDNGGEQVEIQIPGDDGDSLHRIKAAL